jgi:hypothetical protein
MESEIVNQLGRQNIEMDSADSQAFAIVFNSYFMNRMTT